MCGFEIRVRVSGFGDWVLGLGFRAQGLGFGVLDLGLGTRLGSRV